MDEGGESRDGGGSLATLSYYIIPIMKSANDVALSSTGTNPCWELQVAVISGEFGDPQHAAHIYSPNTVGLLGYYRMLSTLLIQVKSNKGLTISTVFKAVCKRMK
jgi:hypothetical protein